MTKRVLSGSVFLLLLFFSGQAMAAGVNVVDLNPADQNIITGVVNGADHTDIYEDVNETFLVPYPSHDGYGIVNPAGGWFDKQVTNNGVAGPWVLDFFVYNSGPYTWSDYHIEFWNAGFTERLNPGPALLGYANFSVPPTGALFQNHGFDGTTISWWAPGWQAPGQTQQFNLTLDMSLMPTIFGLRQVATTVPLPPALWLLGSGLLGLIGLKKRT